MSGMMNLLRRLQDDDERPKKPSKVVVYIFMVMIMGGMCFFVYNWWKCRQSRVLDNENELDEFDFEEDNDVDGAEGAQFRQAPSYKSGDRMV